jgi:plasmid stabilization system protein ParE
MALIVAATLAAIAVWTADGLRRMALAAELVSGESDRRAIRRWLHAAAGGSRARAAAVEFAVAIASVAWVAIAARSVAHLPPSFLTQPILAVIGIAVVVAARAYRWRSADQAVSA